MLLSMGFGLIINVANGVKCPGPWEPTSSPAPIKHLWPMPLQQQQQPRKRGLMVQPMASRSNLKRSFEGKIRMIKLNTDRKTSRPSLDYIKLP
ncbi:hypothetical protein PTTG_26256 [Puccinia triticina 1-1 BBBD Race 1]|uniref:Uncharacterized protein n=1 Tax=Puccinia triticina (isolate 1-1 / race 1 (BBBD)) TaxID=630390 RepID=A0A180GWQ8_PUCT1|nr:hypothetical protein PTTG_26256 [Puccinia triticina 1-1 BBBD Race 1]